jgi:glycosyltransferase involved in cell wall biosynthesis
MNDFQPYQILHITLNELESWDPPAGNHYITFWWENRPLGHLWLERSGMPGPGQFHELVYVAIRDALEQLFAKSTILSRHDLGLLVRNGQYKQLHHFLELARSRTEQNQIPDRFTLSVIVCTRNRPELLKKCVESLMKSVDQDFELVVVDNSPGDKTVSDYLKAFSGVRYVKEERKGLGIARNAGLQAAGGLLLAFTDDDVEVDKHWTWNLKRCFRDPMTMAVTGLVIPKELETRSQYLFEKYWGFNRGYSSKTFDHRFFLDHLGRGVPVWDIGAGANMAYRREAFDLVGGFDERLEAGAAGCSGDTEFWYRILAEGWNCQYQPQLVVYHEHRKTVQELRSQLYYYAKGHACALMVQYEKYFQRGNLVRLGRVIPGNILKKMGRSALSGHWRNLGPAWRELKGTFAGWLYYQVRRKEPGYRVPFFPTHRRPDRRDKGEIPLVSVIIPCYNLGIYLPDAISSVLRQTHPRMEIIVVDDGSTDDISSICGQYTGVQYARVERIGLSAARNVGVTFSRGEFLVFLDADDFLYPEGIATQLGYFEKKPDLAFVSGAHDRIDSKGAALPVSGPYDKPDDNYCSLLLGNYIGMEATVMYRKDLFFKHHFDPRLQASEDYCLNLEIARNYPVLGHTEKIAVYRIHGKNSSSDARFMLRMTLLVLGKQKTLIRNDREKKAYQTGIRNWKRYYRNQGKTQPK